MTTDPNPLNVPEARLTRLLPAQRAARMRIQREQATINEMHAKLSRTGYLSALDTKRRKVSVFAVAYFNKTGKVL